MAMNRNPDQAPSLTLAQTPYRTPGAFRRLARSGFVMGIWRRLWHVAFKRYPRGFVGAEWATDMGDLLRARGRPDEALRIYDLTIHLSWGFHRAYESMGNILQGQGQLEEALECYRKALLIQSAVDSILDRREFRPLPAGKSGPDFMIIGSAKCGTTSLYDYLVRHPRISPAAEKEIHFFDWFYHRGLGWYLGRFPGLALETLTGEATPSYIDHPLAARRLSSVYPRIKQILLLRNPVDRTISDYHHQVRNGVEHRPLEEALRAEMKALERLDAEDIIEGRYYNALGYVSSSLYEVHLKRWFRFFSREQLLILRSEDLFLDPSKTVRQCFDFLGLPDYPLDKYNVLAKGEYALPDISLRKFLKDYFRPYNQRLEALLGMSFGWDEDQEKA